MELIAYLDEDISGENKKKVKSESHSTDMLQEFLA
jgi:hypothetical protein